MATPDGRSSRGYEPQGGDSNLPVPDPTRQTTQLVDRALAGYREIVETRLDAMDKATALNATALQEWRELTERERDKAAADMDRHLEARRVLVLEMIQHTQDVANEKLFALDQKIADRDQRVKQAAAEAKTSLDAALAAQSASVTLQNTANATASNKQEVAFQKLLDQQSATASASIKALGDQISDVKDRITRAETAGATRTEVKTETKLNVNVMLGVLGLIITVVVIVLGYALSSSPSP